MTSVWVVQDVTLKDSSILKSYPYYIFGFYNEGLFEAHSLDTSFNYKGWWEFSHDKNFIQISNIKTGIIERWKIIKLTKDKFWYKIQTDDPEEKDWIYVKLNASN
ncbi:MAG TPA: hypothetical protein PKK00_04765 [Bacteroidales bacterium]|nr:hypothetical protein [Bacteroidales bacterium]HPS16777.1 hypothetical protein [Bacteroidales bacterium]